MRKFLNILMISLMISSQTLTADILSESMSSITNVNSYTEADGTQNVYTGSASIRFNFSKTPPPLFVFTPPSIEAGCNGIDIKGMFMSLLGLDQLGEMLQDAGASLAWGVAVGLIYSLPGVAAAFKMINAWAKKIQELLGNACQTGIAIGRAIAEDTGINSSETADKVNKFFADHSPETYAQKAQKGKSAVWDALGLTSSSNGPEMTKEEKDSTIVAMFKGVYQSDASILGAVLKDLAMRSKGSSGTGKAYETLMNVKTNNASSSDAVSSVSVSLTSTKMASLANLVDISGGASNTAASQASLAMFAYILQYNFIGDLAITSPNEKRMKELYKIGKITSTSDKAKALQAFKSTKKEKLSKLSLIKGYIGQASEDAAGEALGKFIWYGINPNQPNQGETAKKYAAGYQSGMLAPVVEIITIRDDSSKNKSAYISILPKEKNGNNRVPYYNSTTVYGGSMMTSKCVVEGLLKGKDVGVLRGQCNGAITFPEIHKYIKIIKDSPTLVKFKLKNKLIKGMAVKMAKALLSTIDESMSQIKSSDAGFLENSASGNKQGGAQSIEITAKDNEMAMFKLYERGSNVVAGAKKYLEKELAEGMAEEGALETAFFDQDRENKARGLKSFQR